MPEKWLDDGAHVGRRLGRYAILSKIGEGGMGTIYSAFDEELDRRVAVKVLRAKHLGAATERARTKREARALARLSHPNVVQVYDLGEAAGRLFIAMEFVRGETLRVWQRQHDPMTRHGRRAILGMYIAAGRGLAAAHAKGIVHRDFKPDNVVVGDDGRPRVVDFGLAVGTLEVGGVCEVFDPRRVFTSALTRTGTIMGTPKYMSPEQFEAAPSDVRTDVFAFSASLYEALCGCSPFAGETFAERQAAVLCGEVRDPGKALPPWLLGVLLHGLASAPEERYQTMEALLTELEDDPEERRLPRTRSLGIIAAAVVIVIAIIGGQWSGQRCQAVPGHVETVASTTRDFYNPSAFSTTDAVGERSGTYVLDLSADQTLTEPAFVPAPALDGCVNGLRPMVGDLDGNGYAKIIVGRSVADERGADERDVTVVYVGLRYCRRATGPATSQTSAP